MIIVNDFPLIQNEEFLQLTQSHPDNHRPTDVIYLTRKQAADLYQFLEAIQ